jgi:phage shock protein PspC (stress-responsive transcriptional regulator)
MDDMTHEQTEPAGDAAFDPQRLRDAPMAMRRSRTDRHIAGVCGGFAEYARIDPVVVRVVMAALAVTGGGIVLYLAAWVLVPEEGGARATIDGYHRSGTEEVRKIGWIVAGVLAFGALVSAGPWFDLWFPWPLAALLILGSLWLARDRSLKEGPVPTYASTDPHPGATASPPTATAYPGAGQAYSPAGPGSPLPPPDPTGSRPRGPRRRRGDSSLLLLGTGLSLVVLGALWVAERTGSDVRVPEYVAAVLAVVGACLLVGSVIGNGRRLAPFAVMLGLGLALTSQVSVWDAGEIDQTPRSAAAVLPTYELGAGSIRVDLTRVADLEALDGRTVHLDLTAGEILVTVPDGVDLAVTASQRVGELIVLGEQRDGFINDLDIDEVDTAAPDLHLVLDGRFGRMEVRRP